MQQTPVNFIHNADLLSLIPLNARRIVEVGCSSGALAREYKKKNPSAYFIGIEIVAAYASLARKHCDEVIDMDIENISPDTLKTTLAGDCWIFGDVLEHLRDPWELLSKIRKVLPADGCVIACIPNVQHWSVQARLSFGDFRYEDSGLFDRTHIRWFTRSTMIEMFHKAGYSIDKAIGRIFDEPQREIFLPIIKSMAVAAKADPQIAANDAIPLQYVFRCIAN